MADPITAVGLACNIVQLIEIGYKGVHYCWEIYKDGKDLRTSTLQEVSQYIDQACVHLQQHSMALGNSQSSGHSSLDKSLNELSVNCQTTAKLLQHEVQKLIVAPRANPLVVVGTALKVAKKISKIQKLKEQLDSYRDVLNTQMLIKLSSSLQAIVLPDDIAKLDHNIQDMARQLLDGHTKFETLLSLESLSIQAKIQQQSREVRDLLKLEAETTRNHVTAEHDQTRNYIHDALVKSMSSMALSEENTKRYQTLLDRLAFSSMQERYHRIEDAHPQTYKWIFTQGSFRQWLVSEDRVYWVSGKPGSGKSTLMRFLVDSLTSHLDERLFDPYEQPIVLSYFFWEAANDSLQRSAIGCLRAILWQLLRHPALKTQILSTLSLDIDDVQNYKRLMRAVELIQSIHSSSWVVVLDGLDEGEDVDELLSMITMLEKLPNIKLCVSSRPEQVFNEAFQVCPSLRMQALNRDDIELVICEELLQHPAAARMMRDKPSVAKELTEELIEKAEGIFLWVRLVIRNLLRGLHNHDSLQILLNRIADAPKGIYELYDHMLSRNSEDSKYYKEDGALYLQLAIHAKDLYFLEFCLAINPNVRAKYLEADTAPEASTILEDLECREVTIWLNTRTGGLLEVVEGPAWEESHISPTARDLLQPYSRKRVSFIHRTAKDYVNDTLQGQDLLSHCRLSSEQVDCALYLSAIAFRGVMNQFLTPFPYKGQIQRLTEFAQSVFQVTILDYKDSDPAEEVFNTFERVCQFLVNQSHLICEEAFDLDATRLIPDVSMSTRALIGGASNIDYRRLYLNLGLFARAGNSVNQSEQQERDLNIFSTLVTLARNRGSRTAHKFQGLERFIELASSFKWLYQDPCEGVIDVAALIMVEVLKSPDRNDALPMAEALRMATQFRMNERLGPLCTHFVQTFDGALYNRLSFSHRIVHIWGNVSLADTIKSFNGPLQADLTVPGLHGFRVLSYWHPEGMPGGKMYEIDENTSEAILRRLHKFRFPQLSVGCVSFFIDERDEDTEFVENVIQISRQLQNVAEAFKLLGKSGEQVQHWAVNYETLLPFDAKGSLVLVAKLNDELKYQTDFQLTRALQIENWRTWIFGQKADQVAWKASVFERAAQDAKAPDRFLVGIEKQNGFLDNRTTDEADTASTKESETKDNVEENQSREYRTKTRDIRVTHLGDKNTYYALDEFMQLFKNDKSAKVDDEN